MDKTTERLTHLIKQAQKKYGEDYYIFAIPKFLGKYFIAYCSMSKDLKLLLEYLNELINGNYSQIIKSSLTYATIALYGKCFTDASKHKNAKLEANELFKTNDKFMNTHKYLMKMRHEFLAHRGETEHEVAISYLIIPKGNNNEESQVRFSRLKQIDLSGDNLIEIQQLVQFLIEELEMKIKKSGEKLHSGLLKLYTPEQIINFLANNAK